MNISSMKKGVQHFPVGTKVLCVQGGVHETGKVYTVAPSHITGAKILLEPNIDGISTNGHMSYFVPAEVKSTKPQKKWEDILV